MHRRLSTTASALLTAFLALALFAPAGAQAATVTAVTATVPGGTQQETLNYRAAPGEANDVVITTRGGEFGGWLVSDILAPLTAGAGCTSLDAHTASCPPSQTELNLYVKVDLGDSNDWASVVEACTPINYDFNYPCHAPIVNGGSGDDLLFGSDAVPAILHGGPGVDRLFAGRAGATLDGGPGSDWLIGSAANDVLIGGPGDDRHVWGYGGDDTLSGGDGADRLDGGKGNDSISGGRGRDDLFGRAGRDTFFAKDGTPDSVDGGSGNDRATIDPSLDTTRSVEHIRG
jgi:Ca2+-binding RTX toxin-like protein